MIISNFVPFNFNWGQKMLVMGAAGTGKTTYFYSVVEEAVSRGKSVSVLAVDERESEMEEYKKRGATVWGGLVQTEQILTNCSKRLGLT